jgi:Homeodomain-like domain-containing protein
METETQLIVERATLLWLSQRHPDWTQPELASYLGKSVDWVKKWLKRFREADPNDVTVLHSRSRARKTPPASIATPPEVVQRILEIRLSPPENLRRTPGPEAIL